MLKVFDLIHVQAKYESGLAKGVLRSLVFKLLSIKEPSKSQKKSFDIMIEFTVSSCYRFRILNFPPIQNS